MILDIYLYGCLATVCVILLDILLSWVLGEDLMLKHLCFGVLTVCLSWVGFVTHIACMGHSFYERIGQDTIILKGRKKG
ncbi:hypothetical protein VP275E431_P0062 [Vibrio phage 275E43-1]|nr:hypothetical protein VP275E431_P0062 [Vibrio phage 275E43-1]